MGVDGAPFVSAPARSTALSSATDESKIAAVCAVADCTATLDAEGAVKAQVGRCRGLAEHLAECRRRARERGLLGE